MSPQARATNQLTAPSPLLRLPYVASQLLAGLGASPTSLTERARKRIHKSLPVPTEHEILWANVAFGTRTHGLVLTDAGIFFKDGPADAEDDEDDGDDEPDAMEQEGIGYYYLRWENFDPALVSPTDGNPTLGGAPFTDRERFLPAVNPCVRMNNLRVRMKRAGKKAIAGVARLVGPVRSVYRPTVAETYKACLDDVGFYAFFDQDERPLRVEVPANQYDALLQRMSKRIEKGWVPGLEDPNTAAVLVLKGGFTYRQAANLASTRRVPGAVLEPDKAVTCSDPAGFTAAANRWLAARSTGTRSNDSEGLADGAAQAMASGAATQGDPSKVARSNMTNQLVDNASSMAARALGTAGARVLTTALGVTFAPLAMVANIALGDVVGRRGVEAFTMAKDLIIEPEARILGRLFDGVYANVVFEYALTDAEQVILAQLMASAGEGAFQKLGAALRESPQQEAEVRSFLEPLVHKVRRR